MIRSTLHIPRHAIAAALLLGTALGGCSGSDAKQAERLAEINAAALRAEKAADRAEAAAKADRAGSSQVFAEDAEPAELPDEPAPADAGEPAGGEP